MIISKLFEKPPIPTIPYN